MYSVLLAPLWALKTEPFGMTGAGALQFGCLSCHPANSIVAQVDLDVGESINNIFVGSVLQCFDAVGWAAGRASGV